MTHRSTDKHPQPCQSCAELAQLAQECRSDAQEARLQAFRLETRLLLARERVRAAESVCEALQRA